MGNPVLAPEAHFTYRQYKTWPDDERWELIHGQAWCMSPAPTRYHQGLLAELALQFGSFLKGKPCRMYFAPFDVLLPEGKEDDDEVDTVVQPDLVVYCDRSKLTTAGARGAPDLALEILSPSTSKKDQHEKFELFQGKGVREYWIVDPVGEWLCVYRLQADGRFDSGELHERDRSFGPVESRVLEGFTFEPGELFTGLE